MTQVDARPALVRGVRVTLRELVRADVDQMASWPRFAEPELAWANLELGTVQERDSWYDRSRSNLTRRRFSVFDEHDRVVGTIGLRNLDFRYGEGTLGIIVNAGSVGRGYGSDAIEALLRYAFEQLGLKKVYLDVAENNERAHRCYERLGFATIGQHRGAEGLTYVDMVMTRDRWERGRWRS